jgi:ABC-type multidrug transport system fused ATPase/permease subunit
MSFIVVMDAGKVIEIGSPQDLFKKDGVFARLAREQGLTE